MKRSAPHSFLAVFLIFLASSTIEAAIVIENKTIHSDLSRSNSTVFRVNDETGGNNQSLLLIAISGDHPKGALTTSPTISWAGGYDLSPEVSVVENSTPLSTAIYLWDLGNVKTSSSIEINWNTTFLARERFSFFQLSGADIKGVSSATSARSDKHGKISAQLEDVTSGSIVLSVGQHQNNQRRLVTMLGEHDVNAYLKNGTSRGHAIQWDLDSKPGDRITGYEVHSDPDGMSIAAIEIDRIPEPSSFALIMSVIGLTIAFQRRRRASIV